MLYKLDKYGILSSRKGDFMNQTHVEIGNQIAIQKYQEFLEQFVEKVQISQIKVALSINSQLIQLYWEIGNSIQIKQQQEEWDSHAINNLARDIKCKFPDIKHFSATNLNYMVKFVKEYPNREIIEQLIGQIPWGHNIILLERIKENEERFWYIRKTISNGWNRNLLKHWINRDLYNLYSKKDRVLTNFQRSLPHFQSDLAQQILKDPYCFDFLTFTKKFSEKELEEGLLYNIQRFLL